MLYARVRGDLGEVSYLPPGKAKGYFFKQGKKFENNFLRPIYFEVKRPGNLKKNSFNVVVCNTVNYKGCRFRAGDLTFLTLDQIKMELA